MSPLSIVTHRVFRLFPMIDTRLQSGNSLSGKQREVKPKSAYMQEVGLGFSGGKQKEKTAL